jgi:hypothetical protein
MPDLPTIKAQLLESRFLATGVPAVAGAGVYAFFLKTTGALPGLSLEPSGLLYVGMTESSFEARNHFEHRHSGFSTLRRTLGALLKTSLRLRPIPRGDGRLLSNVRHYRFTDEDELRLTEWMQTHLTCGFAAIGEGIRAVERSLIVELRPPLNLVGWPNPQRRSLHAAKDACRQEAECAIAETGVAGVTG